VEGKGFNQQPINQRGIIIMKYLFEVDKITRPQNSKTTVSIGWQLYVIAFVFAIVFFLSCNDADIGMAKASFMGMFGVPRILFAPDGDGGASSGGDGKDSEGRSENVEGRSLGESSPKSPSAEGKSSEMDDLINETNEKFGGAEADASENVGVRSSEVKEETSPTVDGDEKADTTSEEVVEGFEEDLVEVDGERYFFHPETHGKDTGQGTTYKNRDTAELGLAAKVERIKDLTEKLNESGKGVGPVDLPDWFKDPQNPDSLLEAGSIETAVALNNEALRTRIEESDKLITHLQNRNKAVQDTTVSQKRIAALQQEQNELATNLDAVLNEFGITGDIELDVKSDNPTEALVSMLNSAKNDLIAKELKPLVDALEDLKNDKDAKYEDDYAVKLLAAKDAIEEKRSELDTTFSEKLGIVDKINSFAEKLKEVKPAEPKETEQQKVKRVTNVLNELSKEYPDHVLFKTTDQRGLQQFFNFAYQRTDEFNGLNTTHDAYMALKAYDAHIDSLRAEARKKQVESANEQDAKKTPPANYGEQEELKTSKNMSKHERLGSELDRLAAETDSKIS
jgi:hypothetical protein